MTERYNKWIETFYQTHRQKITSLKDDDLGAFLRGDVLSLAHSSMPVAQDPSFAVQYLHLAIERHDLSLHSVQAAFVSFFDECKIDAWADDYKNCYFEYRKRRSELDLDEIIDRAPLFESARNALEYYDTIALTAPALFPLHNISRREPYLNRFGLFMKPRETFARLAKAQMVMGTPLGRWEVQQRGFNHLANFDADDFVALALNNDLEVDDHARELFAILVQKVHKHL